MKKIVSLLLVVVLMFSLMVTGCSKDNSQPANDGQQSVDKPAADSTPAANGQKYTLRVGLVLDDNNPHTIALKTVFKPYVEEKTNGNVTVEVYPSSQLGDDRQTVEGLTLGTIEMSAPSASILPNFDENFNVLDLPFLFTSVDSARKALDGELGDALKESLKSKGILLLGFGDSGFRQLSNSKHPVYTPDDMKGLSIRVMENPLHIAAFKAFGANPTPMAFSELFTALQQKTVDGQDNSVIVTYTSKLHEAQKYFSLTEHIYGINCYLISLDLYNSMPAEYQQIIQDGVKEAVKTHRELVDKAESEYLQKMKDEGVEVNTLTPEQKQLFIDKVQPVYDDFKAKYGEDLINKATMYN